MRMEMFPDDWAVPKRGAAFIAEEARSSVPARGHFLLALSGGKTPWKMLQALAKETVPWDQIHIFQVDERVAPKGHPDRNLTTLWEILLSLTPLDESHIHGMPVEEEDLDAGASHYAETLRLRGGNPPVLDLVHLGLGADGHTAFTRAGGRRPWGGGSERGPHRALFRSATHDPHLPDDQSRPKNPLACDRRR